MENEDKRPVVYVARKITYYNNNNIETLGGYYVSKAYLNYAGKFYKKDGTVQKEFIVDFVNRFEPLDIIDGSEFYVETSDGGVYETEVFKSYADCKKCVDEQNAILENRIRSFQAVEMQKYMEFYQQALKYGPKLEEKYIPAEEREQVGENTNNY